MPEQTNSLELITNGSLLKQIQEDGPRLLKGAQNCIALTAGIVKIETPEQKEQAVATLVKVRDASVKMEGVRKAITEKTDKLKEYLMQPEKDVKAEIERVRKVIQVYDQILIDRENAIKAEAERIKKIEQAKINLTTSVRLRINEVIIEGCKRIEQSSGEYLKADTIEEFDKKASVYQNTKWKMKMEDYERCFAVPVDPILTKEMVADHLTALKTENTYDQVNTAFLEKATPILTSWKTKIPQLRETLVQMLQSSEAEKQRLQQELEAKKQAEALANQKYLDQQQADMQMKVETEAQLNTIESEFKEQATLQTVESAGPKKKVIRFKSDKPVAELAEIIAHCFLNAKFKGIYKLDKTSNKILDENGLPTYINAVAWWAEEFVRLKVDAQIKNTEVVEVAKVIVRK